MASCDYDYRPYESPDGKWHFKILQLAAQIDSASRIIFDTQAEGHAGYGSKEAASSAAYTKIQTLS